LPTQRQTKHRTGYKTRTRNSQKRCKRNRREKEKAGNEKEGTDVGFVRAISMMRYMVQLRSERTESKKNAGDGQNEKLKRVGKEESRRGKQNKEEKKKCRSRERRREEGRRRRTSKHG
jgi:hypothetical protein